MNINGKNKTCVIIIIWTSLIWGVFHIHFQLSNKETNATLPNLITMCWHEKLTSEGLLKRNNSFEFYELLWMWYICFKRLAQLRSQLIRFLYEGNFSNESHNQLLMTKWNNQFEPWKSEWFNFLSWLKYKFQFQWSIDDFKFNPWHLCGASGEQ